jgi:hypothetical protein
MPQINDKKSRKKRRKVFKIIKRRQRMLKKSRADRPRLALEHFIHKKASTRLPDISSHRGNTRLRHAPFSTYKAWFG